MASEVALFVGEALAKYGFPEGHPFSIDRQGAFLAEAQKQNLRRKYGVQRIGYVDIDVHHGDGVFYPYESDPDLISVDIHEDGNYLYPGTGHAHETGRNRAEGTKLNIPMQPGAGDEEFAVAWTAVLKEMVAG